MGRLYTEEELDALGIPDEDAAMGPDFDPKQAQDETPVPAKAGPGNFEPWGEKVDI